ncbi:antimicrobial peptide, SdpC family [Pseudarthrobacter equi]|uniref:Antimicrobial peptide, SdpC family n=1 Tax=Pseudarthrobacter equi TaxID=728066 RepID=A0A1H2BMQ1_9MICC|nr:hypothetical protein [Pseudarthrobacter equi]SDT59575.1 antimicrobial peptide, SdpC family [Pseudarthrobacter equi]
MKKALSAALVSGLLLTGIPASAQATQMSNQQELTKGAVQKSDGKSARSLFEAIWFATGDRAADLRQKVQSETFRAYLDNGSQEADIRAMARQVADALEASKPGYLKKLEKELTSGDVYKVESALASTSQDVLRVVREKYPAQVAMARADGGASGNCLWVFAVAAVAVWSGAVVVNYAGVVNVAGAVNAVGWFNASVSVNVSSPSSLETTATTADERASTENIVAALTKALAK